VTPAEGQLVVSEVHGYRVARLGATTSTNAVVAGEARKGVAEGLVVTADYQSAGRGRFDRRWEAPPGSGLLFSVLLRPGLAASGALALERGHLVVAAVSLAVARAADAVAGVRLSLKWPNDLLAPDGRKVAGVLAEVAIGAAAGRASTELASTELASTELASTELASTELASTELASTELASTELAAADWAVVVGVGLNVSWAPEGASCLDALAGQPVNKDELLNEALGSLRELYGRWDEVAELYRERLATLGRQVVVHLASGTGPGDEAGIRGQAVGVDSAGRLLVHTATGLVEVAAGDVDHARMGSPTGL
jgi:BirA family biotin operon repressor/biotin-[acetyl-CoA-carboxylase] ligase